MQFSLVVFANLQSLDTNNNLPIPNKFQKTSLYFLLMQFLLDVFANLQSLETQQSSARLIFLTDKAVATKREQMVEQSFAKTRRGC